MDRTPDWARAGRSQWRNVGRDRPSFAVPPRVGQESVWDYPRPPIAVPDRRRVVVELDGKLIVDTRSAVRVLETASPPTFYLPPADSDMTCLEACTGSSRCEWKGDARYWAVVVGDRRVERAAWSYPDPFPEFHGIRDHLAFYPGLVECQVDGVRVEPQPGRFYGGWVTPELVGPFKGEPGSEGW